MENKIKSPPWRRDFFSGISEVAQVRVRKRGKCRQFTDKNKIYWHITSKRG